MTGNGKKPAQTRQFAVYGGNTALASMHCRRLQAHSTEVSNVFRGDRPQVAFAEGFPERLDECARMLPVSQPATLRPFTNSAGRK